VADALALLCGALAVAVWIDPSNAAMTPVTAGGDRDMPAIAPPCATERDCLTGLWWDMAVQIGNPGRSGRAKRP